ncbi:MAG TPA: hypothetical protein VF669_14300, partial [Tepidisphaeraceae bacterium]
RGVIYSSQSENRKHGICRDKKGILATRSSALRPTINTVFSACWAQFVVVSRGMRRLWRCGVRQIASDLAAFS